MLYSQMLFALAFDKLVWGVTPSLISLLGSSLILGSAICVAIQKQGGKTDPGPRRDGAEDEEIALVEDVGTAGDAGEHDGDAGGETR